jgi:hypothetical protein
MTSVSEVLTSFIFSTMVPNTGDSKHLWSHIGGVMVSVLAIEPKVRGFKPGRGDGFFRAIEIRSTSCLGGEVKLSAPCSKILRHVKKVTCKYEQKYFARSNSNIPFESSSCFLLDDSAGMIVKRALVDETWVFLCWLYFTMVLHAHISVRTIGPLVAAVHRRSFTPWAR